MSERATRIHLAVGVTSLERSRAFYERIFKCPPTRVAHDQIDWILNDPPINFSIFFNPKRGIGIEHFGLDLPKEKRDAEAKRLSVPSGDVAIHDPDNVRFEVFSSDGAV